MAAPRPIREAPLSTRRCGRSLFAHPTLVIAAHSEYLENEEFVETADESLREYIRIKFANRRPDIVVANTAPALQFVIRHRDALFPNVPIVFISAVAPAGLREGTLAGVTGRLRTQAQAETLELMLKLHPATKRVHVIAYAPGSEGFDDRVLSELARFSQRVTLTYETSNELAEALATVRSLPADSLILFGRYTPITRGPVTFPDARLAQIVDAAKVPIYSSGVDTALGRGIVGGMMRTNADEGGHLGEIVLRILAGAAPESIPVESSRNRPAFDWGQLQRWNIDESLLPEGSEIRYRVPTVWELYGSYITATIVVVLAQLALIAGLLRQRAELRRAENRLRASEASLRTSFDRIRNMAGRLINAQEVARANIARDLHDDVTQKLTFIALGISDLKKAGRIQDPNAQRMVEELSRDTQNTFESIRRLSHDLHPATLNLLGLASALRSHCHEVAKKQDVTVRFSSSEKIGTVHPDVAVCFFRIAQESVRNATAHGGATDLAVTLERSGDRLALTVADDGRGFDVDAVRANGGGLGLVTIEERANMIGGTVTIVSEVGVGTTVRLGAPANPAPPLEAS